MNFTILCTDIQLILYWVIRGRLFYRLRIGDLHYVMDWMHLCQVWNKQATNMHATFWHTNIPGAYLNSQPH